MDFAFICCGNRHHPVCGGEERQSYEEAVKVAQAKILKLGAERSTKAKTMRVVLVVGKQEFSEQTILL